MMSYPPENKSMRGHLSLRSKLSPPPLPPCCPLGQIKLYVIKMNFNDILIPNKMNL